DRSVALRSNDERGAKSQERGATASRTKIEASRTKSEASRTSGEASRTSASRALRERVDDDFGGFVDGVQERRIRDRQRGGGRRGDRRDADPSQTPPPAIRGRGTVVVEQEAHARR